MTFVTPETLPVAAYKDIIQAHLIEHQTVIVSGDTGCGKTTQLPKYCLELAPDSGLTIGCTQPRRIAAMSVSERVSEELGPDKGFKVGYKIRFRDRTNKTTRIKFMTDGVLLAETRHDPLLRNYSVIIIDEAHERSLNIDFLLGFLKNLLPKRPDLKLIITSATIDTQSFATHFSDAPIVHIEGRTFPVDLRYSPVDEEDEDEKKNYIDHCVQTVLDLHLHEGPGDMLVFLPTEKDIRSCCTLLNAKIDQAVILPLFGRLQAGDQKKIFLPQSKRKIVVATNVAETSITVPNIRFVVDTGLARQSFYNSRAKTNSLPIKRISRASCDQRKGRCGRVGPGLCVRLYSEEDYDSRSRYSLPEIKRSNLAEVILQMVSLKLGRPEEFPFVDVPSMGAIRDGYRLLTELGAIDDKGYLSKNGRLMAKLPIDPCISRIIIEAHGNNCLSEITIIGSALAIQDPRVRPAEKEKEADLAHKEFSHPHSDFMVLLNIWNHFHGEHDQVKSWSRLKKFCKRYFLSFQRMREWFDLHEQMSRILKQHGGFTKNKKEGSYEAIHQSLLSGFLRNIARKQKGQLYQGGGNKELMIFPGSHQFLKGGNWILAASFLETNRLYGLTVATIEPEWIELIGGNLCKYSWSNPRWQKKTGQVVCDENVSIFGLPVVSGRTANFGRRHQKNRRGAQDIFIQQALLTGHIFGKYSFLKHNLTLIEKWRKKEAMVRKRDILVDENNLYDFYRQRLPLSVYDRFTLNRFLKKKNNQTLLKMSEQDIINRRPEEKEFADYPPSLTIGSTQFKLEYNFAPGSDNDGVTIKIPVDLVDTINPLVFDWLVPGLLQEKTEYLLRKLPKQLRKQLVPINRTVESVLDDMSVRQGSYYLALENSLFKLFRISIRRSDWPNDLPSHLKMRYLVCDPSGKTVVTGREFSNLLTSLSTPVRSSGKIRPNKKDQQLIDSYTDIIFTDCEFNELPERIPLLSTGGDITGYLYPTLQPIPDRGGVKVTFEKNKARSLEQTQKGLLFLFRRNFSVEFKSLKRACSTSLSGPSSLWFINGFGNKQQAVEAVLDSILTSIFSHPITTIPSKKIFSQTVSNVKQKRFFQLGQHLLDQIMKALRKRNEVAGIISKYSDLARKSRSYDKDRFDRYDKLLHDILPHDFFNRYKLENFDDCIRYMEGLAIRIERAHISPAKDDKKAEQLTPHLGRLKSLLKQKNELSDDCLQQLDTFQIMIQEFRISLFAPELRTKFPVSAKKLKLQFNKVRQLS